MYKVHKAEGKFSVIETGTDQVIDVFNDHEKAHKLYRALKRGAGFQGNTPPFFLKRFAVSYDS